MPGEYFPAMRQLAEYEIWCNSKMFDAAGSLNPGHLFERFPFGFRTIHATLFHIVEVFQTWGGCVGPMIAKPPMMPYDRDMTLVRMAEWNAALSITFLAAVDASHAAGLLDSGRRIEQLFHLVTHGTHHRTQMITMLRLLSVDPPYEAGNFGGWSKKR